MRELEIKMRLNAVKNDCNDIVTKLAATEQFLQYSVDHLNRLGYSHRAISLLLNKVIECRDVAQIILNEKVG